jgi:imidazolonepropionase-like amidohydrolase
VGPQRPAAGGYDANLLLVDGDPLEDIGALRRVSGVVLRGAMIDIRG